jgi:translation elongation factor EF-1alpha
LLYDCGLLPEDQLAALGVGSARLGTTGGDPDLALLVEGLQAEREQAITIDVTWRHFTTARRRFIVADAPGHDQCTRNLAAAASIADLAVLLIDARQGLRTQARRHSHIVALFGIREIVLAVNKMDLVGWQEAEFERIKRMSPIRQGKDTDALTIVDPAVVKPPQLRLLVPGLRACALWRALAHGRDARDRAPAQRLYAQPRIFPPPP